MWPQYAQEYHPVELHELSLEELTGTRPSHRGALMYLKQKGIPEYTVQFKDTGPQIGHLRKLVKAIEHDFYTGPVTRHPEVQPPPGRGVRLRPRDIIGGPSQSQRYNSSRPMASRELMTGRRDGRAAALFQRMKDRSDQYVVEESPGQGYYQQQDPYGVDATDRGKRPWQRSPWEEAAEHPLGLPDRAFEPPVPKPKPKPKLQNPAQVQKRGPPGYSQVDSIRQRQQAPLKPGNKPVKIGCTWKGETSKMRFHSGVQPYEMDFNRTARGWSPGHIQTDHHRDNFNQRPTSWGYEEDQYSPGGRQRAAEVARSRQIVGNIVGPSSWGGESDDL
ncbi:uncharacterized protein LOC119731639 [Patiria miniata]|uniref:Uncharacterized protein n=1 Tax=Patiria miniata TaxID=46514 RepID=A0A914ABD6_PATMI|nr:uncharacterized protein LOC119731639 [Patiria miniata]